MDWNQNWIKAKELIAKRNLPKGQSKDARLPPGQHLVTNFPVLDLGVQPDFDNKSWKFRVFGEVENPINLSYDELLKLPKTYLTADFHCVTRWSQYDIKWAGVKVSDLLALVKPTKKAKFVIAECADGYTTNIPMEDFNRDNCMLAYELESEPIPRKHGWPLRTIIPHLYAWKSAKFLHTLRFISEDEPGFWEVRGYNNHADPFLEERYS